MSTPEPVTHPLVSHSSAIVALSEDDVLLRALTVAMVEQAAIVTSPSVDRFIDQLAANGGDVALIDASAAPAPIADFMLRLRRQFPRMLIVLTGSGQLQTELSPQIADGTIFRFAHKPASAQRLKLLIGTALRRSQQHLIPLDAHNPNSAPRLPSVDVPVASASGSARATDDPAHSGPRSSAARTAVRWYASVSFWLLMAMALMGLSVIAWLRAGHSLPLSVSWPP
jgi:DNA-binding response OmpR family regulator